MESREENEKMWKKGKKREEGGAIEQLEEMEKGGETQEGEEKWRKR